LCDLKQRNTLGPVALLREIISHSRLTAVRDQLTWDFLRSDQVLPPVICPTINAVRAVRPQGSALLHVDHYELVGPERYEQMVDTARQAAAEGKRLYLQANHRIPPGNDAALRRVLDLYAQAELVLTSRLHGCIIGLAMGRKVLAVSGDRKIESFMQAIGLGDWVCSPHEIDSLPERLAELPLQPVPARQIEQAREQNRQIARRLLQQPELRPLYSAL
jgi:hypothetical protein